MWAELSQTNDADKPIEPEGQRPKGLVELCADIGLSPALVHRLGMTVTKAPLVSSAKILAQAWEVN